MIELREIAPIRRPDGSRWNDGALFRLSVTLVDADFDYEATEEAPVEAVQSYAQFQCFVLREFGVWYRFDAAEDPVSGARAWSSYLAGFWTADSRDASNRAPQTPPDTDIF